MLPSINMMSAAADSTAVKSDELQRSTTSISDTTPTDIEDIPSDTIPVLSKRELRRQRVANRNLHYNILGGPSYTPDFGLLVGGSALMTFRMNPSDTTTFGSADGHCLDVQRRLEPDDKTTALF